MSHSEAPISFTLTLGPGRDLFTIRGNDAAEFVENAMHAPVLIEWCRKLQEAATGNAAAVTASAPVAAPVVEVPTPQVAPAPAAPVATPTQSHACQHGPMVFRTSKPGADPWRGWFCPLPQGTAGRCKTVYER